MAEENQIPQTPEELRAFVHAEVRKALADEKRTRGWEPYTPPGLETKVHAPARGHDLPAWARHEEGTHEKRI